MERRISVPFSVINEGLKGIPEGSLLPEESGEPLYITDLWSGISVHHLPSSSVLTQLVPAHGSQILRISKTEAKKNM